MSSSDDNSSENDEIMEQEEQEEQVENENESVEEESDEEKTEIRSELKDMPFEDLLKLKKQMGTKDYNEAIFGKSAKPKITQKHRKQVESSDDEAPMEISSKKKVRALGMEKKKFRPKQTFRDPRFDARVGYFNGRKFREQYDFVNELRCEETTKLKAKLSEAADSEEVENIKFLIQRSENQDREYKKQIELDKKRQTEKEEIKTAKLEGKNPYYVKKSTKKAEDLVSKFIDLKESGKLLKHMDKRRKKVTAKDRKKLNFST